MTRFLSCFAMAALAVAAAATETGEINGARFRIDMPETWNGTLIMYCHGYSPVPGNFDSPKPNPLVDALVSQGYALAQSGYSTGGWAIQEAVQDTQALRRYFVRKHGEPKESYVTGHSMGGFLTMTLVENHPDDYDGGLALCGPLASASWFMERRVFDMRVVFDYFFPGTLPPPDNVPVGFAMSRELNEKVTALLEGKPAEAEAFRRFTGIRSNKEAAGTVVFFTYILKDLQQRGGGNAFDNRNTIYEGTADDNALNDGVKRYTASPRAAEYLRTYYTPTGRLSRPVLAIHTTYDPLVPPWVTNMYSSISEQNGGVGMFVQQYVKHNGHCNITPEETVRGMAALREWKRSGTRPAAGTGQ